MGNNNVRIMGEGTVSGGNYGNVRIMGDGRISGELEAVELHVTGNVFAENNVKVGRLKISGSGKFASFTADEVRGTGKLDFKGTAALKDVDVSGEIRSFNGIKAEKIKVKGSIEDKKSVEAEQFESYGAIDVNSLNADEVNIKLYGKNRANEITGSIINVIYPLFKKILPGMFFFKKNRFSLVAETIEADRIYLEHTEAGSVRGNDVSIGPGCRIKLVEYRDKISVDKSSVVEQQMKV